MRELRHFGTVFLYLAVVFGVFALHAFVVLADNGMSYQLYGASIINAVILAKILHVAEASHFGEKFTGFRPFWSLPMSSRVGVGLIRGKSLAEISPGGGNALWALRRSRWIMCVMLVPFLPSKEILRAYGEWDLTP